MPRAWKSAMKPVPTIADRIEPCLPAVELSEFKNTPADNLAANAPVRPFLNRSRLSQCNSPRCKRAGSRKAAAVPDWVRLHALDRLPLATMTKSGEPGAGRERMARTVENNSPVRPIRFGIMCRGHEFAAWEASCIRNLMALEGVELALLIVDDRPQPRSSLEGAAPEPFQSEDVAVARLPTSRPQP